MSEFENATIAIQKSGRLTEGSLEWLNNKAGSDFLVSEEPFDKRRELFDTSTGITLLGYSNGDTLKSVASGQSDLAIAGSDKYYEFAGDKVPNPIGLVCKQALGFAACRMVLARPRYRSSREMMSVATSYPRLTREYFEKNGRADVLVDKFSGGVEMIARRGRYDGIVDITQSGDSLTLNDMEEVDTILKCEAMLIRKSSPDVCPPEAFDMLTTDSIFDALERRLQLRMAQPSDSLASRLVNDKTGNSVRKKLGEEGAERIAALAIGNAEEIVNETADNEFVGVASLVNAGVGWRQVSSELIRRYVAAQNG